VTDNLPAPVEARVVSRLQDCGIEQWDRVTGDACLFNRSPFLQAFEAAMPDTLEPRYVVFRVAEAPVAVMVCQILTLRADRIAPAESKWANRFASLLGVLRMRAFLCGNFMGWGYSGIVFAPDADRVRLWPQLAAAISRVHQLDRGIRSAQLQLVLDLSADDVSGARHLEAQGYRPMAAEPDMILHIDPSWRSFADYRAALKSKYRKASNEMDAALAAAGCVIERLTDVESHADELIALHLQVHEQSPHRFVSLRREFIPALAQRLGDDFICTVIRRDDRILGFITTLIDGDTALAYVVGHDVAANTGLPIYLRLLQTAVETGIERGCRRVTYGRTALEPKARIGAVATPLTIYGRHRGWLVGPWLMRMAGRMAPSGMPPLRSPFKSSDGPGGAAEG